MANKPVNTKAPKVPPPQSLADIGKYERTIARLLNDIQSTEESTEAAVRLLLAKAAEKVGLLNAQILAFSKAIERYAVKNRSELVDGGKSATMPGGGMLQWYTTPPAIVLGDKPAVIVERLEKLQLPQFIRTKKEVDKEAMLKDRDLAKKVEGVSITQHEKFAIRPAGRDERIEHNLDTKRWKIIVAEEKELPEDQGA